jgi:hypothetical protein
MRSVRIMACILAVGAWGAAGPARAGVHARTISDSNGRIVVELSGSVQQAVPPVKTFFVAIAPTGTYSVSFQSVAAAAARERATAADTVTASQPYYFRGTRVVRVRVVMPPATPVGRVTIDYTPAAVVHDAASADPLLKSLVMNTSVFPAVPRTGAPDPWFSRSPDWVKLTLTTRGMYAVTGAGLVAAGVNLDGIDPSTLRVYTGGAALQARELGDPDASWRAGQAMREVRVRVEAGSDGTFDAGDRIILYGLATEDWADYYGPEPDTLYYRHTHARTSVYYLTWGGSFPGAPLRMADVDAAPVAAPDRTTYFHREYRERDLVQNFDYRGDGWLWHDIARPTSNLIELADVDVRDLVTTRPQVFRTVALSPYVQADDTLASNFGHHAVYFDRRGGVSQPAPVGSFAWDAQPGERYFEHGRPVRIVSDFMREGLNEFFLQVPGDVNSKDRMYFAWFSLGYERRIRATNDAATFSSPDTSAVVNFAAGGFSAAGTLFAFDVTDPWNPSRLTAVEETPSGGGRRARLAASVSGGRRHFWVGTGGALRTPTLTRVSPTELRNDAAGPHMIIVCHRDFRAAAERLRAHRAGRLPLYASPSVRVVTTDEIYDNFSAGLPDPMAIRNYIKFLYENSVDAHGNPRLAYVLFLGDATEDFRNNVTAAPDRVPTNVYFTRITLFTMATDDWYGHLDVSDQFPGAAVGDVAVGRLPAESVQEAQIVVDKVIGYELDGPREPWCNDIILVADDEISSFAACETAWTYESETLTYQHASEYLAVQKIYLTEYPAVVHVKPEARLDFLEAWNRGALLINYIGHGSSQQMADELVFLESDVSQLNNDLRLPLLMAFSCTIGDFANPAGKSLSEKLILRAEGGVVAAITASADSYPDPNNRLDVALFKRLTPRALGDPTVPVGVALMQAKLESAVEQLSSSWQEENNFKYNLIGDPALVLRSARQPLRFESTGRDTLVAGARRALKGRVYRDGAPDAAFEGTVRVTVREPAEYVTYDTRCSGNIFMNYYVPGGVIYDGTADVAGGEFEISIRVPRVASTGPLAYATAYAVGPDADAAATMDSVLVVVAPTLADSLALRQVDGAPRVDLGFKSGLEVVKPGDTVRAIVRDQDGINILSTTNEGRQAILLDDLPVPIDVNPYFSFDHGGVDTSGVLLFPLPDLEVGSHRLVYKVSDSFGSTTLDTLFFQVTDALDYYAHAVMNYPNPFQASTQLLFRLSNRAAVTLEIFTVSGKRVRRLDEVRDGGEVWIEWDGRDAAGDDIANGTYLYVATVDFVGLDRPPTVLRGKMTKIR